MKTTYKKNPQLIGKNNSQREIREIEFELEKFKDKKHIIHYIEKDPSILICPNCSSK
jgi:hypothetical protein